MDEVYSLFFLGDRAVFKKVSHLTLKFTLMLISNVTMLPSSKSDVDRQTERQTDYCNPLMHAH